MTPPATSTHAWQRLNPRMLLVHPVHETLRQLPLLLGAVVVGSTTGDPRWALAALAATAAVGAARWFTTGYCIDTADAGHARLRSGIVRRSVLSVPRSRIRSVTTDARMLHRLLGLSVLRIHTGREDAAGDDGFELDAVAAGDVSRLRAQLLTAAPAPETAGADAGVVSATVLARWRPSWLRYAPLNASGLVTVAAAGGAAYQTGAAEALRRSRLVQAWLGAAEQAGTAATAAVVCATVVSASALLATGRSLAVYGNLVLSRRGDVLETRHGLLRVRERSYDMARLRGGTLREPLLVRALGGARLDAAMTGLGGAGESSMLLPPCPAATAETVLAGLVGDAAVVRGDLVEHGPAAARRRWVRALSVPLAAGVVLGVADAPGWVWPVWAVAVVGAVVLAADRNQALGHAVSDRWLVARAGSLQRRRDCIATAGIVAWTVRQSWFQRRAGVATLVAATAAGAKRYPVIDIPAEQAWAVAARASPWVTPFLRENPTG